MPAEETNQDVEVVKSVQNVELGEKEDNTSGIDGKLETTRIQALQNRKKLAKTKAKKQLNDLIEKKDPGVPLPSKNAMRRAINIVNSGNNIGVKVISCFTRLTRAKKQLNNLIEKKDHGVPLPSKNAMRGAINKVNSATNICDKVISCLKEIYAVSAENKETKTAVEILDKELEDIGSLADSIIVMACATNLGWVCFGPTLVNEFPCKSRSHCKLVYKTKIVPTTDFYGETLTLAKKCTSFNVCCLATQPRYFTHCK